MQVMALPDRSAGLAPVPNAEPHQKEAIGNDSGGDQGKQDGRPHQQVAVRE